MGTIDNRPGAVRPLALLTAALVLALNPAAVVNAAGARTSFTNFSLAATPPSPVGTTCPGAARPAPMVRRSQ